MIRLFKMSTTTSIMNRSYVFSQKSLAEATELWVITRIKKASEKEEVYRIVQVALPWFMEHLGQNNGICMFSEEQMLLELDFWKADQMINWPHQKVRIEETCDLILDFFHSRIVDELKMVVT